MGDPATQATSAGDEPYRQHEAEQRRAWLALTAAQRLDWLAQAKRFCARALGAASGARRNLPVSRSSGSAADTAPARHDGSGRGAA